MCLKDKSPFFKQICTVHHQLVNIYLIKYTNLIYKNISAVPMSSTFSSHFSVFSDQRKEKKEHSILTYFYFKIFFRLLHASLWVNNTVYNALFNPLPMTLAAPAWPLTTADSSFSLVSGRVLQTKPDGRSKMTRVRIYTTVLQLLLLFLTLITSPTDHLEKHLILQ